MGCLPLSSSSAFVAAVRIVLAVEVVVSATAPTVVRVASDVAIVSQVSPVVVSVVIACAEYSWK